MSVITIERKVLEKNDEIAQQNRAFLAERRIFTINIVSSPGAGKTSILERTIEQIDGAMEMAVIEGDVQTDFDAQRVARYNVPVAQIITNGACHLEARLVQDALHKIDLTRINLLVIENVGNLVCPAGFDLGEDLKVVVLSTTEGDDKPLKYPAMFRNASVLLINKVDLIPYVNCHLGNLRGNALQINPALRIFETSCTNRAGIAEWSDWLMLNVRARSGHGVDRR
jgi:hydrogenase nickel incorporation protein HypB